MSLNRFAISALSKYNKVEAVNEEIMIDKATGEILVKGFNGEFISFNRLSRLQSHLNSVKQTCIDQNVLGKVYGIELEDHDLPKVVPELTNLTSSPQVLTTNLIEKLLISVDVDAIANIGDNEKSNIHINEPKIAVEILLASNSTLGINYSETVFLNKSDMSINILEPQYPNWDPGDTVDYTASIVSIEIDRNDSDLPGTDLRMILYNILCVIKEVV